MCARMGANNGWGVEKIRESSAEVPCPGNAAQFCGGSTETTTSGNPYTCACPPNRCHRCADAPTPEARDECAVDWHDTGAGQAGACGGLNCEQDPVLKGSCPGANDNGLTQEERVRVVEFKCDSQPQQPPAPPASPVCPQSDLGLWVWRGGSHAIIAPAPPPSTRSQWNPYLPGDVIEFDDKTELRGGSFQFVFSVYYPPGERGDGSVRDCYHPDTTNSVMACLGVGRRPGYVGQPGCYPRANGPFGASPCPDFFGTGEDLRECGTDCDMGYPETFQGFLTFRRSKDTPFWRDQVLEHEFYLDRIVRDRSGGVGEPCYEACYKELNPATSSWEFPADCTWTTLNWTLRAIKSPPSAPPPPWDESALLWHLAPPNSSDCDSGRNAYESECEQVGAYLRDQYNQNDGDDQDGLELRVEGDTGVGCMPCDDPNECYCSSPSWQWGEWQWGEYGPDGCSLNTNPRACDGSIPSPPVWKKWKAMYKRTSQECSGGYQFQLVCSGPPP